MNIDGVKKIYLDRLERFNTVKKILHQLDNDNFTEKGYLEILGILKNISLFVIANHLEENILIGNQHLIHNQLRCDLQSFIDSQT